MSKIKMRCTTCGKWFQSANAKEVTCPDCVQKARKEKLAAKNAPPPVNKTPGTGSLTRPVAPPPPKPASGTSHWFDEVSDVKVGQPDQPSRPKLPSSPAPRDTRDTRGGQEPSGNRGPGGYRVGGPGTLDTPGYRPRQPMEGGFGRGPQGQRPGGPSEQRPEGRKGPRPVKEKKPATPPKPKREKIPPPTPFVPTPEQVAQIEARYQELATPQEFDGIRTQISKELSIPKKAVKKVIQEFRERNQIPSWWEVQTYKGDSEELEKIKAAYEPYLPVPAIGIHKKIAEELGLKPGEVYQAIKAIRLEMNLPQFNDPALHAEELAAKNNQEASKQQAETGETSEAGQAETGQAGETSQTVADAAVAEDSKPASDETPVVTEAAQTPVEVAVSSATDENAAAENKENS